MGTCVCLEGIKAENSNSSSLLILEQHDLAWSNTFPFAVVVSKIYLFFSWPLLWERIMFANHVYQMGRYHQLAILQTQSCPQKFVLSRYIDARKRTWFGFIFAWLWSGFCMTIPLWKSAFLQKEAAFFMISREFRGWRAENSKQNIPNKPKWQGRKVTSDVSKCWFIHIIHLLMLIPSKFGTWNVEQQPIEGPWVLIHYSTLPSKLCTRRICSNSYAFHSPSLQLWFDLKFWGVWAIHSANSCFTSLTL